MSVVILSTGYYPDPDIGKPVSGAYIYVGEPDLDPEVAINQKTMSVLQEDGTTVPVAQPLRTSAGGVPVYNGSPVTVLVDGEYSLKVLSSQLVQVYYVPSVTAVSSVAVNPISNIAALRLVPEGVLEDGLQASVAGYYEDGDGGGGLFYWDANSTATDNNGTIIKVTAVTTGRWIRNFSGKVSVRWFGAKGAIGTDDSAAIQAVSTYLETQGGGVLYLPANKDFVAYQCNSITINTHVAVIGDINHMSRVQYNGDGASGSYVLSFETQSYAEFQNVGVLANHTDGATYADYCCKIVGLMDLLVDWRNLQFANSTYDAVYCESTAVVVNWTLDKVRFDGVGGYALRVVTQNTLDSRPLRMTNFTYDNSPHAGRGAPANWGLGVLRIVQQSHVSTPIRFEADSARLEVNKPLVTTTYGDFTAGETPSLFYFEHATGAGDEYPVDFSNMLVNNLAADQALTHVDSGTLHGSFTNISVPGVSYTYKDSATAAKDRSLKGSITFAVIRPTTSLGTSGCSVSRNTAQSITKDVSTDILFNSVQINERNEYVTGTGVYTCVVSGVYQINAAIRMDALVAGDIVLLTLELDTGSGFNPIASVYNYPESNRNINSNLSHLVRLSGDDELKCVVLHDSAASRDLSGVAVFTRFSVIKIN